MSLKILLVDDEPYVLNGMVSIIKKEMSIAAEIETAMDGFEAVEKAKDFIPDIVITDITMPEMNGLELIDKMKKTKLCDRFVVLTGYNEFDYIVEALRLRALDYLMKPVDKERLFSLLHKLIQDIEENKNRERELQLLKIREVVLYGEEIEDVFFSVEDIKSVFCYEYIAVAVFQFEKKAHMEKMKEKIRDMLKEYFWKSYTLSSSYNCQIISIVNWNENEEGSRFRSTIEKLEEDFNSGEDSVCKISISYGDRNVKALHDLYINAVNSLVLKGYLKKGQELNDVAGALYGIEEEASEATYGSWIKQIIEFVGSNYKNDISLEDAADFVGLHPNYVSSVFKRKTGVSFIHYLNSHRIDQAKQLLSGSSKITVDEIGRLVGYYKQRQFFKVFKLYTGMTPGQYRKTTEEKQSAVSS